MKTVSITVERNFHILNDDRFIMEKISLTGELEPGEDEQAALDELRQRIAANIRTAYPKIEEHLNFHVVRQVTNGIHISPEYINQRQDLHDKSMQYANQKVVEILSKPPEANHAAENNLQNAANYQAYMKTKPEKIDNSFNLIDEIAKSKTIPLLKVYKPMCKEPEEAAAYVKKMDELSKQKA